MQLLVREHAASGCSVLPATPRDTAFEVPLQLDGALTNLWLTPPRNYSSPHSTESLRAEEFEDLLMLRPWKPR